MPEITRRRLLRDGAIVTGGAVMSSLLGPHLQKAIAAGPPSGSMQDIEHVVVLMEENRSFDHYYGTLAGVRGFGDPDAITLPNGRSVFYQPAPTSVNAEGYLLPWHLDTRSTSAQAIPSTSHAWAAQHEAWDNGAMDAWVATHLEFDGAAHGPFTMGYYERDDIPFHFALAENFTVCDAYHCSILGPTWPNRMYLMTGWVDPNGTGGGPMTSNVVPAGGYTWTTYAERLEAAGVDWRVYQEEDDYGCNPLEFFAQFQAAGPTSGLYQRGLTISQPGQFEADVANGTLPTISWIIPTSGQSEHPAYLPASGSDFVASKLEALAANPDVWSKTLVILNYDENDGLFDHVVPPTPPAGTPDEFIQVGTYPNWPIGGGIRVPCVLVSPWTVGGWVATENFDHTSVLQLMEQVTGVTEPNISQWRRQTFGDLSSALGFTGGNAAALPPLPQTRWQFWQAEHEVETLPAASWPTGAQTPPTQQTHRNPRSAAAMDRLASSTRAARARQDAGAAGLAQSVSRYTESLTTHRSDFPEGLGDGEFPGRLDRLVGNAISSSATYAYVTMINGGLAIIDTATYTPVSAQVYETNPYGVVTTPDGTTVYVGQSGTNLVEAYPISALQSPPSNGSDVEGASIVVGVYPHGMAITPDGSRVVVADTGPGFGADGSNTLSVIDTATNAVSAKLLTGQSPQIVAITPDSSKAFVTCLGGLWVTRLDRVHRRKVTSMCPQAHGVAVSPDGTLVYVADSENDRVVVIDGSGEHVVTAIPVGTLPWNVAFTSDGSAAYVTNANADTISVIDTATARVIGTINVGRIPTGIAAYNDEMWVCGNVSGSVSVIDTGTNAVTQSIELGISLGPITIAFA